ncbi:GatB/YqeY domain-containing protein [Deinococcus maricopensis]|uniref:GatB/YqeY domain-containing protein n=1 Tax=Deinococcus maricopensis (strain DSM 21211 / LMG 22137 / NRRL B-23946 / LB-34) TaxID=709986 RepID=E8U9Z9_DEIML|nr:GatB/YqeY domain-containing protein [Deinococcus maricopensis]ADV67888.1 hypothetical protein Deima_2250 [Deinococcus maricopensis DSM 21211]
MLYDRLKADLLTARKARDTATATTLTTLVGAVETAAKAPGAPGLTDEVALGVIKQTRKALEGTVQTYRERGIDTAEQDRELALLAQYLPTLLSEDELRAVIEQFRAQHPGANIAQVMAHLKAAHPNGYDGALAARLARA